MRGIHLFHYGPSSCSQRVRMALIEKGLTYESHVVDLGTRAQFHSDFLAINPRGLVPALVEDGNRVVESIDIIVYLDEHHPQPPLLGTGHSRSQSLLDRADRAQDALRSLTHEFMFRARGAMPQVDLDAYVLASPNSDSRAFLQSFAACDNEWLTRTDQALVAMSSALDVIEAELSDRFWLEGDLFGLADIAWVTTAHRLEAMGWPWTRWPAVAAWYYRAAERPSFKAAVLSFETAATRAALAGYVRRRAAEGTDVAQRLMELV